MDEWKAIMITRRQPRRKKRILTQFLPNYCLFSLLLHIFLFDSVIFGEKLEKSFDFFPDLLKHN